MYAHVLGIPPWWVCAVAIGDPVGSSGDGGILSTNI
jgi:hypothetical protein